MKIGVTERGDAGIHLGEVLKALPNYDGAILITKHPHFLLDGDSHVLPENTVIHCTITGLGHQFEPGGVDTWKALRDYKDLVNYYGGDRVVLRVDPIIPTTGFWDMAHELVGYSKGRVRISFLDAYDHVRARFHKAGLDSAIWWDGLHAPLHDRQNILTSLQLQTSRKIEVCGEPGFQCQGCVSFMDICAMGLTLPDKLGLKGQRGACTCIAEKTEMLTHRGQCVTGCLYCYWR
jgi:hypothetical protein